jgi:hypothetical protein
MTNQTTHSRPQYNPRIGQPRSDSGTLRHATLQKKKGGVPNWAIGGTDFGKQKDPDLKGQSRCKVPVTSG